MESSSIELYIPQKSKKRVFMGSSSTSMEAKVIEKPPKLKAKAVESKKVIYHEIIDLDMDDEDCNDVVFVEGKVGSNKKMKGISSSATRLEPRDMVHSMKKAKSNKGKPSKVWAKKIQDEWRILEKDLPDTIFVRVYESRMDLLRAVIIGAEGTPYHDGLFFFDIYFPSIYPAQPPHVHYHSGGLRINPNLYYCGKVCLSLLNTWYGGPEEMWTPGVSTVLQVLVSIQGLILNANPYFNEPGNARGNGSAYFEEASLDYNEETLILSLKTMVYTMKNPPKNFKDLVIGHFCHQVRNILMACEAYTQGVQVGCHVNGGKHKDGKSCSAKFKNNVASYVEVLIHAFKKIGAKEAEEFIGLTGKISGSVPKRSR